MLLENFYFNNQHVDMMMHQVSKDNEMTVTPVQPHVTVPATAIVRLYRIEESEDDHIANLTCSHGSSCFVTVIEYGSRQNAKKPN